MAEKQNEAEKPKNIYQALLEFSKFNIQVAYDSTGQAGSGKFRYASLNAIYEAVKMPLAEVGIVVVHKAKKNKVITELVLAENHSTLNVLGGNVVTDVQSSLTIPASLMNDPKKLGGFITYAKRYTLAALLSIDADEDKDVEDIQPEAKKEAKKQAPKTLPKVEKLNANQVKAVKDKLRKGGEPASIITGLMARYQMSEEACQEIWALNKEVETESA